MTWESFWYHFVNAPMEIQLFVVVIVTMLHIVIWHQGATIKKLRGQHRGNTADNTPTPDTSPNHTTDNLAPQSRSILDVKPYPNTEDDNRSNKNNPIIHSNKSLYFKSTQMERNRLVSAVRPNSADPW